jgi:putative tryptophan/tyrosine transport system substrate-binding protein
MLDLRRRQFLTLLGGAVAAWPLAARAQQRPIPLIGSLNSASPVGWMNYMAGFRRGLGEIGYVEQQNVAIEYRWAEGLFDRLPAMAAELAERKVDVVFASGGIVSIQAAMAATQTIPIVFTTGVDPVSSGFLASLGRPGQNVTGVSLLSAELAGKRLEVLSELVPKARVFAMLTNPKNPADKSDLKGVEDAAMQRGYVLHVLSAETEGDFDAAFATAVDKAADALLVSPEPFFNSRRDRIVALAARRAIPTIYSWREYPLSGGLISYGANLYDQYRVAGSYVGRILKGAKPADLPVQQPTKLELVINLKTAKTLGIEVPPTPLLARADEVIE